MKIEVYICVLCACLVTLKAHKRSARNGDTANDFTFLSYKPNKTQDPVVQGSSSNVLDGSKYEEMTNHTFLNETKSALERIILQNLAENEWPKNDTQYQDVAQDT